jgi:small-conductance mechanosensitive channel
MRSTSIKTFDNIDMVIPNGEFITSQVVNWSLQDHRVRAHLDVGVAYGSDAKLVRKLLLKVADEHPLVLKDPAPMVWFTDFGDNALAFKLLVWFRDYSERMNGLTDLRFTVDEAFAEHGITIPFPQRTLGTIDDRPLRVELAGDPSG